jgi:hypothetical protein
VGIGAENLDPLPPNLFSHHHASVAAALEVGGPGGRGNSETLTVAPSHLVTPVHPHQGKGSDEGEIQGTVEKGTRILQVAGAYPPSLPLPASA